LFIEVVFVKEEEVSYLEVVPFLVVPSYLEVAFSYREVPYLVEEPFLEVDPCLEVASFQEEGLS
jgi:hypothetical protein